MAPSVDQPRDAQTSASTSQLTAFVSFPSPYTQTLLISALVAVLPSVSITLVKPDEADPPALQWADYDLLSFDAPHAIPSRYLISSYVYRKALIRKHELHLTLSAYLAKASHRGQTSVLSEATPQGWVVDLQFADELDELLLDDLYELAEGLRANEEGDAAKRWYILKPGFADRAQGIRLFSTEDELRAIFESFEPPSDDEDEDDDEDSAVEKAADGTASDTASTLARQANDLDISDDEDEGTGVMTSHLRHFIIQEYLPDPILFDLSETASSPASAGHKFHLRAYVLVTGGYTVHLARTMLALFSGSPFSPPVATADDELDLRPHLTNTCLQTDTYGAPMMQEDLVRLFWDLEGSTGLSHTAGGYVPRGMVDRAWLDETFACVGNVCGEAVRAGAECGSFGLQLMPNAFEIFGVDLVLSFPPTASAAKSLPVPRISLLEFNASPDFHQSGSALRPQLAEMFRGVVRLSIAPFFRLETRGEGGDGDAAGDAGAEVAPMQVGEERWGWRLVAQGEVRGSWA